MARDNPVILKDFAGLNRRDGADKMLDNQFLKLQNVYPFTKGLFYKRNGTTSDVLAASIPLCSTVTELIRFYDQFRDRSTIYYCEPDGTTIAAPTTAITLAEINGGDLFDGGAAAQIAVTYSWVGRGRETAAGGSATITPSTNAKGVRVTIPAFPTGVTSANVFWVVTGVGGTAVYAGTITASAGTLDILYFYGVAACENDARPAISDYAQEAGSLKRGTYYIATAWYCQSSVALLSDGVPATPPDYGDYAVFNVREDNKAIRVSARQNAAAASTDGAKYVAFFIGLRPPGEGPMMFAGIRKVWDSGGSPSSANELLISSFPEGINAQSIPNTADAADQARFNTLSGQTSSARGAFLIKKKSAGTIVEIPFSRSFASTTIDPTTGAAYGDYETGIDYRSRYIKSAGDPFLQGFQGRVYVANGKNLLLQTDGFTLSEVVEKYQTNQPGFVTYVGAFKSQLVATVATAPNQIFGSNAYQPNNWASGGTGTDIRFVTIGDGYEEGVKAVGVFGFTSGTEGPKTFLMGFKKNTTWITNGIPDLATSGGVSMDQLSGRIGCLAARSVVNTPIGLVFLGSDGDVYLSRGQGEPYRIGGMIKPFLLHLAKDDALMAKATACFHEGFYKLSYPSSSVSTGNDAQLWADMRTDPGIPIVWCGPHTGINIGPQRVLAGEGDNSSRLACLVSGAGTVVLDDVSTFQDLGVTISSVIESKVYRMNAEMHWKRLTSVMLDAYYDSAYTHRILFEAFMDDQYSQYDDVLSSGGAVWDASSYDAALWSGAQYFPIPWYIGPTPLVGRTFQLRLTHANNAQFILSAIGATFQPEKRQITP